MIRIGVAALDRFLIFALLRLAVRNNHAKAPNRKETQSRRLSLLINAAGKKPAVNDKYFAGNKARRV